MARENDSIIEQGRRARRETVVGLRKAPKELLFSRGRGHVRVVADSEIERSLKLILWDSTEDQGQLEERVRRFIAMAQENGYDLRRQMVGLRDNEMVCGCMFVPSAGGTAFIFSSCEDGRPEENGASIGLAVETVKLSCRWAFDSDCGLLEALIEPSDLVRKSIYVHSGFRRMTDLLYMSCLCEHGSAKVSAGPGFSWLGYENGRHEQFKEVIGRTYEDSLDCPELENLREMEDVMTSHKSAGEFDKRLWQLLLYDGEAIGVLLLSPVKLNKTMELTYMGLSPEMRGKGFGEFLLREALWCAGEWGFGSLTLAVDVRNHPAYRLYERMGLKVIMRRSAFIRSVRWEQ